MNILYFVKLYYVCVKLHELRLGRATRTLHANPSYLNLVRREMLNCKLANLKKQTMQEDPLDSYNITTPLSLQKDTARVPNATYRPNQ